MNTASIELVNGKTILRRRLLGEEVHISSYDEYKKALFQLKMEDCKNVFDRDEPELNQSERKLDACMNAHREKMIKEKYVYSELLDNALRTKILEKIEPRRFIRVGACKYCAQK